MEAQQEHLGRRIAQWLIYSWAGRFLVVLAAIALVYGVQAAIGGSSNSDSAPCGIVRSGQKLCGQDLATYCRGFEMGSLNQNTVLACSSVGVDVVR